MICCYSFVEMFMAWGLTAPVGPKMAVFGLGEPGVCIDEAWLATPGATTKVPFASRRA